jgi:predicted extracellular nuclease
MPRFARTPLLRHRALRPAALGLAVLLALAGCRGQAVDVEGIAAVQGSGERSPHEGQQARIEGVVTLRMDDGAFVQSLAPDADAATAEGLFVQPAAGQVALEVGQHVVAQGKVGESGDGALLTTLADATIERRGTAPLPEPVALAAAPADWEALEGMRVRIDADLTVVGNDALARFGEIDLAFGGRVFAPTEQALPGAEASALREANAARRIVLDDASSAENPASIAWLPTSLGNGVTLRAGSTLSGLEAVVDHRFGAYRLQAGAAPATLAAATRPAPPQVDGAIRIAGMNLLNLFNGDGQGGGFPTERGADDYDAYTRQLARHVAVISALDPSIIAAQELENDGYGPESAVQELATALNGAQADARWTVVAPAERPGTDSIAVGLLYRADRVEAVGAPALKFGGPFERGSRPPLAQSFRAADGGPAFTVVSLHFKSKGGCESAEGGNRDAGDGQGCFNAQRVDSVEALHAWIAGNPTGVDDGQRVALIGDFNAYGMEDPMRWLREQGWNDPFASAESYSFVFDGQSGRLDHALLSASMAEARRGAAKWHSNADEPVAFAYDGPLGREAGPWRASDHDPLVLGFDFGAAAR